MSISPRAGANILVTAVMACLAGLLVAAGSFVINGYWWLTITAGAVFVLSAAVIAWRLVSALGWKQIAEINTDVLRYWNPLYVPGATRKGPLIAYGTGIIIVGLGVTLYNLFFNPTPLGAYSFLTLLLCVLGFFIVRRGVRMRPADRMHHAARHVEDQDDPGSI